MIAKQSQLEMSAVQVLPLVEVCKGLYLGNEIQAASKTLLIEHGVRYVVNAAGNQASNHFADFDFEYLPLDLYDTSADDITQFLPATYEFIGPYLHQFSTV